MAEDNKLIKTIKFIGQMNDKQISEISQLLLAPSLNFIRCQETAEKLEGYEKSESGVEVDYDAKKIAEICSSLIYLRDNLGRSAYSENSLREKLPKLFNFNGISYDEVILPEDFYQKLADVYTKGLPTDRHWHETGLMDIALDFDSFIDIRPVFIEEEESEDESENHNVKEKDSQNKFLFSEAIPMIVFRVAVQKDFGETKSYVFQMTEDSFASLETEVSRIRGRLLPTQNLISSMVAGYGEKND